MPTIDRLARFADQLIAMKAQGASTENMLIRLRVQGLVADQAELAAFWEKRGVFSHLKSRRPFEPAVPQSPGGPDLEHFNKSCSRKRQTNPRRLGV
jgi:hypothetical protein